MKATILPLLLLLPWLSACTMESSTPQHGSDVVWVTTTTTQALTSGLPHAYSGVVRPQQEIGVAFQINGRINHRHVQSGQAVTAGQLLFNLDPHDLEQALQVANAEQAAAQAELSLAQSELKRVQQLVDRNVSSQQVLERAVLTQIAAQSRVEAARALVKQATNQRQHTVLSAPFDGVLIDVTGEVGQVVEPGMTLARLATISSRDVEVNLPDFVTAPTQALAWDRLGNRHALILRETAGAVDAGTRTWRVRYRFEQADVVLPLGSLVQVAMLDSGSAAALTRVPIAAVDERGNGAQVWRVDAGVAQPVPVQVVIVDRTSATLAGGPPPGTQIIALGTHLLEPGMRVQVRD